MRTGVLAALCAAFFVPATGEGHMVTCGDRTAIEQTFKKKYNETRVAFGVTNGGALVELFVSPDGRWTLMKTRGRNQLCPLEAGKGWRNIKQVAGEPS